MIDCIGKSRSTLDNFWDRIMDWRIVIPVSLLLLKIRGFLITVGLKILAQQHMGCFSTYFTYKSSGVNKELLVHICLLSPLSSDGLSNYVEELDAQGWRRC